MGERKWKLGKEVFGYQKFLPELRTKCLDSGRGVQHVAMVRHFAAKVSDLGRDDFSAVGGGLERGADSVALEELSLGSI